MAKSIQSVLSLLLLISSVCGLRIIEFSAGRPKLWFSLLYISLVWSIYCFFVIDKVIPYVPDESADYIIHVSLNVFAVFLSIFVGIYYDKKFRNCLKKLAAVDDTLKKLGTTTDCQNLNKRTVWIILGWSVIVSLLHYCDYIRWRNTYGVLRSICLSLMLNYCSDIATIDDLIFANILGYLGLKFDQVNEHLHKLTTENVCGIKRAWESPMLLSQQRELLNAPSSKHMTWIVIQLHLELQKISRELNSIFEIQMTWKMICYFGSIAESFRELYTELFIRNRINIRILINTIIILWLSWYIFKVFLINYMCERVSAKANTTGEIINKILYFSCDVEIRENILQFLLQLTQAPLKFYGLKLFQFGYKFLYGYSESILTLAIVLIQVDRFKHALKNHS